MAQLNFEDIHAVILDSLDPAFNLALEEYLFQNIKPGDPGLFLLWRNGPSIIVGRHQNAVEEINEAFVTQNGIPVVRRMTGGGAVYHDDGNLNFSFILPRVGRGVLDFTLFLRPVLQALRDLGVDAEFSSRNDITVGSRKISGSAQRLSSVGVLHHGTIMFNLDLETLTCALAPSPEKFISKGISSVRERVANLVELLPSEIDMDTLCKILVKRCSGSLGRLSRAALDGAEALARSKYRTYNWNYGASPSFTERRKKRFSWGMVDLRLEIKEGLINSCRFYGDFFSVEDLDSLEKSLCGVSRDSEAVVAVLDKFDLTKYFSGCNITTMRAFIASGHLADA